MFKPRHGSMGIIALSNEAVSLMKQSLFAESLSCLKEALRQLNENLKEEDSLFEGMLPQDPYQEVSQTADGVDGVQVQVVRLDGVSLPKTGSIVFYNGAFVLAGSEKDVNSGRNTDRIFGVLLYNIAAVHQLSGKRKQAMDFYNLASKAITKIDCDYYLLSDILLSLAIVNNKACCHAGFGPSYELCMYAYIIQNMLMTIPTSEENEKIESELWHFRRSVLQLQGLNVAAPAA